MEGRACRCRRLGTARPQRPARADSYNGNVPRASQKSSDQPARTPLDLSGAMAGPPVPADRRLIPTISLSQGSPPATLFPCCPLGKPDLTNPLQRHQKQRRDRICALVAAGGCAAVPSGRPLSLARAIIRAPAHLVGVDGTPARHRPQASRAIPRSPATRTAHTAPAADAGCSHASLLERPLRRHAQPLRELLARQQPLGQAVPSFQWGGTRTTFSSSTSMDSREQPNGRASTVSSRESMRSSWSTTSAHTLA